MVKFKGMKHVIVAIISLFFVISCAESKKGRIFTEKKK